MSSLYHLLKELGIFGIFLSIFLENTGVPFPTEVAYLYSVYLIGEGKPYWMLLAILVSGHVIGSSTAYAMGYWSEIFLTKRFSSREKFMKTSERLHKWYSKYGALTVFITRFVGYVRPWSSFVAGFAQINFLVFFIWTLLGSIIFSMILLEFTVLFVDIWHKLPFFMKVIVGSGFLISIFMFYVVKIIWDRYHRRISLEPEAPPESGEGPGTDEPLEPDARPGPGEHPKTAEETAVLKTDNPDSKV